MKRLKTILLFLIICISCFAQNRTRTNTSTNANNTTNQRVIWESKVEVVEEEVSAVSIIATDQGVRVLNANGTTLEIYNLYGVKIASYRIDSTDKNITLTLGKGCYLFKVRGVVRKISIKKEVEDQTVFQVVEKMPEFPGGMAACLKFVSNNIKYPTISQENGVQGKVIVQFVVNKDGSIVDPVVVRSVDPYLDKEALRVISMMPKWSPCMQRGKPVRVKYTVPVTFRLQ